MSLISAAERFSSIDRSALTLDIHRCLHSRDQFASCKACFNVCPVSAIQPGNPPGLDSSKCVTCLACIPACPVGAFEADDAMKELLTCVARLETTSIELLCGWNPCSEQGCGTENIGIQVRGCLAGLGAGSLMILAAMGLDSIFVRMDACAGCDWGMLRARLEQQISEAQILLCAWNKQATIVTISNVENPLQRPVWNAHNPPLSRRDLFRLASRQGQVALGRALEQSNSSSSNICGRDRRRIISAVSHLSASKAVNDPILTVETYVMLGVSDSCTACGVCARACPMKALHYVSDSGETTFHLTFSPQLCIGCDLCVHVCMANAFSVDKSPAFNQLFGLDTEIVLREGALAHCEVCKAVYAADPDKHLCPACDFRRLNPFGARVPPFIRKIRNPSSEKGQP